MPKLYVIAGPNGAGKTTFAWEFLPHFVNCRNFINADLIAAGLSPFSPDESALQAGRLLLKQIRTFARKKIDFGFETTLAGMTYGSLFRKLKVNGYRIHLFYLWIPNVAIALRRIEDRVRRGGHRIPEKVVRRRFRRGLKNLWGLYRPLLDSWTLFDNSEVTPRLIAIEEKGKLHVADDVSFGEISRRSALSVKAERALRKAVREAIQDHARTGDPMAIWRKGKVVWVPAGQLLRKRKSRGKAGSTRS